MFQICAYLYMYVYMYGWRMKTHPIYMYVHVCVCLCIHVCVFIHSTHCSINGKNFSSEDFSRGSWQTMELCHRQDSCTLRSLLLNSSGAIIKTNCPYTELPL